MHFSHSHFTHNPKSFHPQLKGPKVKVISPTFIKTLNNILFQLALERRKNVAPNVVPVSFTENINYK
jgi:hypothetical protein